MKTLLSKTLMAATIALAPLAASAQHRADQQHLDNSGSFSMILLGDPQGYVKYDINQPLFELQTAWIADNIDNHSENGRTHFPEYFPVERNSKWNGCAVAVFPNRSGVESLENAAFEFNDPAWGKILVVCNEFAPRDEVLQWTAGLISSDRFKNHRVIYMTHSLLKERTAERTDNEGYEITPANWGQQVWDKLLSKSENIVLAICGHTGSPGDFEDSIAYRCDKNAAGRDLHQMMFNVQILGGGWEGNGGDGWLRILEFMPDGETLRVKTYSPLFGISPSTRHLAHRTDPTDRFDLRLPR